MNKILNIFMLMFVLFTFNEIAFGVDKCVEARTTCQNQCKEKNCKVLVNGRTGYNFMCLVNCDKANNISGCLANKGCK